jgi:hypothetical protein
VILGRLDQTPPVVAAHAPFPVAPKEWMPQAPLPVAADDHALRRRTRIAISAVIAFAVLVITALAFS